MGEYIVYPYPLSLSLSLPLSTVNQILLFEFVDKRPPYYICSSRGPTLIFQLQWYPVCVEWEAGAYLLTCACVPIDILLSSTLSFSSKTWVLRLFAKGYDQKHMAVVLRIGTHSTWVKKLWWCAAFESLLTSIFSGPSNAVVLVYWLCLFFCFWTLHFY